MDSFAAHFTKKEKKRRCGAEGEGVWLKEKVWVWCVAEGEGVGLACG